MTHARLLILIPALALSTSMSLPAGAATPPPTAAAPTTADVLSRSAPSDWRPVDPANILTLDLASGRVVIELFPAFAPEHAANIEKLVRGSYFDGLAIVRAQDNYVVQWGDPNGDDPKKARPLGTAQATVPPEFTRPIGPDVPFTPLASPDGYAPEVGFSNGFPAGRD